MPSVYMVVFGASSLNLVYFMSQLAEQGLSEL